MGLLIMKILFDGDIYFRAAFGGMIRYYNQLIGGLISRGVDIGLLIHDKIKLPIKTNLPNCQIVGDIKEHGKYDIFHGSYYSNYTEITKSRIVVTVHDMIDEMIPRELIGLSSSPDCANAKENAIRHANHIVAISHTTKRDLIRLLDVRSTPVSVIYHGVDSEFASVTDNHEVFDHEPPISRPFILHVGGREGYKNFVFLLEAFAMSGLKGKAKLVAVGSQTFLLPKEQDLVEKYQLHNDIRLTGYVSDRQLRSLYSRASVLAMPSMYEGFGYPMIEAMACGTTVACSTAPALVELGQGMPFVFNPLDVRGAATVLEIAVTADHSQRKELARKIALAISVDAMVDGYCEVYQTLLQ